MRHFREELELLSRQLLTMAATVELAISRSVTSLVARDSIPADAVLKQESAINRMQIELDATATRLLVLYQPMAEDLRLITAIMKTNTDLERMADLAVNIAERSLVLSAGEAMAIPDMLPEMANLAQDMVRSSVDSFLNKDAARARSVLASDDAVDEINKRLRAELVTAMQHNPKIVPQAVDFILVAHDLERIADHATNVAENVVFLACGIDVRHHAATDAEMP